MIFGIAITQAIYRTARLLYSFSVPSRSGSRVPDGLLEGSLNVKCAGGMQLDRAPPASNRCIFLLASASRSMIDAVASASISTGHRETG